VQKQTKVIVGFPEHALAATHLHGLSICRHVHQCHAKQSYKKYFKLIVLTASWLKQAPPSNINWEPTLKDTLF